MRLKKLDCERNVCSHLAGEDALNCNYKCISQPCYSEIYGHDEVPCLARCSHLNSHVLSSLAGAVPCAIPLFSLFQRDSPCAQATLCVPPHPPPRRRDILTESTPVRIALSL